MLVYVSRACFGFFLFFCFLHKRKDLSCTDHPVFSSEFLTGWPLDQESLFSLNKWPVLLKISSCTLPTEVESFGNGVSCLFPFHPVAKVVCSGFVSMMLQDPSPKLFFCRQQHEGPLFDSVPLVAMQMLVFNLTYTIDLLPQQCANYLKSNSPKIHSFKIKQARALAV